MSNPLEITGSDIAKLNDSDLRDLIGLLCEADYRRASLPVTGILWGGEQEAKDGGLDVIVRSSVPPPPNSFILRSMTGFQVKKSDMPSFKILKEMKPNGILREEISSLLLSGGAYIIVSSGSSTSNISLKNRLNAMHEAVRGEKNNKNLKLEFYDCGRVASWVRLHPAMILWVRNKIGRELQGWRPYENWAKTPGGVEEEYLIDDGLRLYELTNSIVQESTAIDGLIKLRDILSMDRCSVRLTGLSGVGKTRFAQALFDERICKKSLDPALVFYTDISDNPYPNPIIFAEQLVENNTKAILIVDNCAPDLHHRLTQICTEPKSSLSLLTIEYDIRDDLPEVTSVFRLEPASTELIEKLIAKRNPHISEVDIHTIAFISGGNARIALGLAQTVKSGQNLAGLRDNQLFERLFWQRNHLDESLMISAEVCSLLYSFNGTDLDSQNSELKILASIIKIPSDVLFRHIAILKSRNLVQCRDIWRAVLPQALANRLAKNAWESIPSEDIVKNFLSTGSERLIKSFCRRLGYLHDCNPVVQIIGEWFSANGWIGKNIHNLSNFGIEIFKNLAPVSLEKTLEVIENAANENISFTSRSNHQFYEFVKILQHLAYESEFFERSVNLISRFAITEKADENNNSVRKILSSLFQLYLSGTQAKVDLRASFIQKLLNSNDENEQSLGLYLLASSLNTGNFTSFQDFSFGARSRDYGYRPRTYPEVEQWYETFIDLATNLAVSNKPSSRQALKILATKMRGLWRDAEMFNALEKSVKLIQEHQFWKEGWIEVKAIIGYDKKKVNPNNIERLYNLEKCLRPNNLLEKVRAYVLSGGHEIYTLVDYYDNENFKANMREVEGHIRALGVQVAQDIPTFCILLPELITSDNDMLSFFCRGLANGASDKQEIWNLLYSQYKITPAKERKIDTFLGFLSECSKIDYDFYNSILDKLVSDELLGEWFPIFQTTSVIDKKGVKRLYLAIENGKVRIETFRFLASGRAHESINDYDLAELLKRILSIDQGLYCAIEILSMRFHGENINIENFSEHLQDIGREVLLKYSFEKEYRFHGGDYALAKIAHVCLNGDKTLHIASEFSNHFLDAISKSMIYSYNYPKLLNVLANCHPFMFLNIFIGGEGRLFNYDFDRSNPLDQLSDDTIVTWCDENPYVRYPRIILYLNTFNESEDNARIEWKPIVYKIIEKAPDVKSIIENLARKVYPSSWSGNLSTILQNRSVLLEILFQYNNIEVSKYAKKAFADLQEKIKKEQQAEQNHYRKNQSFE